MVLVPEKVDFTIATTDVEVVYTERNGVRLSVEVQIAEGVYKKVDFLFTTVAQVKCTTLNFFEHHYNEFTIEGTSDTLFYQITNSPELRAKAPLFDPTGSLALKHYLLIGYDSYIEIIASGYKYS